MGAHDPPGDVGTTRRVAPRVRQPAGADTNSWPDRTVPRWGRRGRWFNSPAGHRCVKAAGHTAKPRPTSPAITCHTGPAGLRTTTPKTTRPGCHPGGPVSPPTRKEHHAVYQTALSIYAARKDNHNE